MAQADVALNTISLLCPMPIILTAKKIKKLTVGRVLDVASDDEGIKKICRLGVKRPGMN